MALALRPPDRRSAARSHLPCTTMAPDAKSAPPAPEPQKLKRAQRARFVFTNAMREQVTTGMKEGKFEFGDVAKDISTR